MVKGTNENKKDQEETAAQDQVNTTKKHKQQQEDETIRTKKSSEPEKRYIDPRGRGAENGYKNNQRSRSFRRARLKFPCRSTNTGGIQNKQRSQNKICYKYGRQFDPNHLQSCPEKDKLFTKSAKQKYADTTQKYADRQT